MQHCINGHKETVQFFNCKRALSRHCLLMIYRERDVPNCTSLIHAAAIKLQTDLGGGHHWPKAAWAAFHLCTDVHKLAAADAFLSDRGETEQEGAALPLSSVLPGSNRDTSLSANGENKLL